MESFPDYLQAQLDRRQWTRAELSRASHVDASLIGRWLRGEVAPGVPGARAVADACGRPLLEVLVAAGLITAAEAKQRTTAPTDPAALTNEQLLAEIERRMRGGGGDRHLSQDEMDATPGRYTPAGDATGQPAAAPRARRSARTR